ncbi:MAG: hypothetical protein HOG60_00860, partial [Gammaproteobacteria bacterium]|nr:hypothetical protein [Gammaproteobacteria bacterium]
TEDNSSYTQIKADDLALPEFARQAAPIAKQAAIKEFLPDAPAPVAPVQNKKTSAGLINRFWTKLIGSSTEDTAETIEEPAKPARAENEKSQNNRRNPNNRRNSNNRNRNRNTNNRDRNKSQSDSSTDSGTTSTQNASPEKGTKESTVKAAETNSESTTPKPRNQNRKPNRRGYNRKPRTEKQEAENNNNVSDKSSPAKDNGKSVMQQESKDAQANYDKNTETQSYAANYQKNIAAAKTPTESKPQPPSTNTED